MIESVAAVERTEAVSIAVASGLAVRNGRAWRERRLNWLGALRAATGDEGALGDAIEDETHGNARISPSRARIAESQERLLLIGAETGGAPEAPLDVADLVRRLGEAGARSIPIQARLGATSVRSLVTANAVNGA